MQTKKPFFSLRSEYYNHLQVEHQRYKQIIFPSLIILVKQSIWSTGHGLDGKVSICN